MHRGRGALARLYTPPGAPTVRRAADASAPIHKLPRSEQADVDARDARADVEQAAPEATTEPAFESGVRAAEHGPSSVDTKIESFDAQVESVDAEAESSFSDEAADAAADYTVTDGAPLAPSADAAPADDDWFAAEVDEPNAPPEPAHPTPAFNDLRGIERLASDAASNDFASSYPSYLGVSDENGSGESRAAHDDSHDDGGTDAAHSGEYGVQPMAPAESQPHELPARDTLAVVAEMLERTALRVRDGNLTLPSDLSPSSDAAALAAVLSALLRTPQG